MSDPGRCLHSFRKLRDYAAKGCWEAQVTGSGVQEPLSWWPPGTALPGLLAGDQGVQGDGAGAQAIRQPDSSPRTVHSWGAG